MPKKRDEAQLVGDRSSLVQSPSLPDGRRALPEQLGYLTHPRNSPKRPDRGRHFKPELAGFRQPKSPRFGPDQDSGFLRIGPRSTREFWYPTQACWFWGVNRLTVHGLREPPHRAQWRRRSYKCAGCEGRPRSVRPNTRSIGPPAGHGRGEERGHTTHTTLWNISNRIRIDWIRQLYACSTPESPGSGPLPTQDFLDSTQVRFVPTSPTQAW